MLQIDCLLHSTCLSDHRGVLVCQVGHRVRVTWLRKWSKLISQRLAMIPSYWCVGRQPCYSMHAIQALISSAIPRSSDLLS